MSTPVHHDSSFSRVQNSTRLYWFNHHGNSFERVGPSVELGPVDPVLIAAAIVSASIPNTIQIGVGAHVVPPPAFLVVSTVT